MIDPTPLREKFLQLEKEGINSSQIALKCGRVIYSYGVGGQRWVRGDTTWLKRKLGIMPYWCSPNGSQSKPHYKYVKKIHDSTAIIICDALGLDYHEVGL